MPTISMVYKATSINRGALKFTFLDIFFIEGCLHSYKAYSYLFLVINKFTYVGLDVWSMFYFKKITGFYYIFGIICGLVL